MRYRITSKLNSTLSLGWQQPTEDSTALAIAGMQNNAELQLNYRYTDRDYLTAVATQRLYHVQDGHYLGSGQDFTGIYQHKFNLAYPDWHIDFNASASFYHPANTLSADALKIIPPNVTADVNFYMPQDSYEYGVNLGYGEAYLLEYTHDWRTFANVGVLNYTRFGMGWIGNFGIAGTVFGRDHLAFFVNSSKNLQGGGPFNYVVGALYKIFF